MLALESQQVILLRMARLSGGGAAAGAEMQLMAGEKLLAAAEETGRLFLGASNDSVIKRYRKRVRANVRRLSK